MALFGATLSASGVAQTATAPSILPYTAKLIAGGGSLTNAATVGNTCPSGAPNTVTDKYGDGCLGSDIGLTGPRYAIADANGNVFFSDYTNALIRRVDAITGVVTAVAGGAGANPASNASCGASGAKATDNIGDGCLGTQVKLGKPTGLAFDKSGNLVFADYYNYAVRTIAATNGFVPATGGTITLIDGNAGGASASNGGYQANNGSWTACSLPGAACVVAATTGRFNDPYDISVDTLGDVVVADYYTEAVLAVNPGGKTDTIANTSIPATTVAKLAGAQSSNNPVCTNNTSASTSGCFYNPYADGVQANTTYLHYPFSVATDGSNNVYIANMYYDDIALVGADGILHTYAGATPTANLIWKTAPNTARNTAAGFPMGASFGVSADTQNNLYIGDQTNGLVWRVDAATSATKAGTQGHLQFVVAGGGAATTIGAPCSAGSSSLATDIYGDGCPALKAKFGSNGTYGGTTTTGLAGVKLDQYSNLYIGDSSLNLVREIATGAQFGIIGSNQPTNTLDIHFAAGDNQIAPVTAGGTTTYPSFVLTAGATNFSLGVPVCTTNNDATTTVPANTVNPLTTNTTDCLIPVTATPSALGNFTGTLTVTSANGGVGTIPLSGTYAQSPNTRTSLSFAANTVACTGTTTYSTTTPITLTATVTANGPAPPTASGDTVTFFANGTQIGQPVQVTNTGSSSTPIYTATTSYTFATTGTYTLTAVFSGDSYFHGSTGTAPSTLTSSTPSFTLSAVTYQQGTIVAGQTALYSFNVNQNVYAGAISFAVTGLPANSNYTLSSTTVNSSGCSSVSTVALSINTQAQTTVGAAGIAGTGGGRIALLSALLMAMLGFSTLKRSRRLSHLFLLFAGLLAGGSTLGCSTAANTVLAPATPSGTYTITVTPTGTVGSAAPITFTMTVK